MLRITLRDYQEYAIYKGITYFNDKKEKKNKIICSPCGSGKSIIIAGITNALDNAIILQPSKELLLQNYAKFIQFGGEATIFSASVGQKNLSNRTFATIGSVKNLANEFKKLGVKNILMDEAHLFSDKDDGMFKNFIKELGEGVKILGLTATPFKMKVVSGETFYDNYSEIRLLTRMRPKLFSDFLINIPNSYIHSENYWKNLKYISKTVSTKQLKLNTTGSDYTDESLKIWYNSNDLSKQIINEIDEQVRNGKSSILVFVPNVQNAIELQQICKNSNVITAQTKSKERDQILKNFVNKPIKEVQILFSVATLLVGFDAPNIDALISARSTNSLGIHLQMLGRAVRKSEYIEEALIIDFTENTKKFGRIEEIDVKYIEGYGWALCRNSNDQILNNVRLDDGYDKVFTHQLVKGIIPKQEQVSLMPLGEFKDEPINSEKISTKYLEFCLKNVKFVGMIGKVNKTIIENELLRRKNL